MSLPSRFQRWFRPPAKGAFQGLIESFDYRFDRWSEIPCAPKSGRRVGILVTPWLDTAVPFYCIEIGLSLRAAGDEVVFLFDQAQTAFNTVSPASLKAFSALASRINRFGEVLQIKAQATDGEVWTDDLDKLLYENAVWYTKGEIQARDFLAQHPSLKKDFALHGARILSALKSKARLDWILIPGGVFGLSGLYLAAAQKVGLDYTTFDSGPGRFFTAHRGIASHSADLPDAFERLVQRCKTVPELRAQVLSAASELFNEREELRDFFKFQNVPRSVNNAAAYDLLVCLNYRADTAALFRNRCFSTVEDWMIQLVDWGKARNLKIGIRPHPVQRHSHIRSTDRLDEIVRLRDPEGRCAEWIPPDASVNTYDLVEKARVILPFTSTIGIESAYLGRSVVLNAFCYYDSCGFATACASPAEYFAAIERALNGEIAPTIDQREAAAFCLYLAGRCRSVHSIFTPQPADFERWVKISPVELWLEPELVDFKKSLLERLPLTWVRHERRYPLEFRDELA